MKKQIITAFLGISATLAACKKDDSVNVDTEYPVIEMAAANFPQQCSTVKRGETFSFKTMVSDNAALGSVSIDIHHNFDHHTHSTEVESCDMDPKKEPVKPFLLIKSYEIPGGPKSFQVDEEIEVPADIDPGDYHFLIRLTDEEGWQTIKGLSIKVE